MTAHIASTVAGDATRRRLIHATARVLSRKGYSQTRLQEIAEAADLRAPAVYYHFASRDDLVSAALREGQVLVRDDVVAALDELPATASSRTRVLSAVAAHLRIELELSDLATAVVRTAGHVPHHIRTEIQPEIDAYHDLWRGLLETAYADGVLRPGTDRSVARMPSTMQGRKIKWLQFAAKRRGVAAACDARPLSVVKVLKIFGAKTQIIGAQ